ncbi:MAG: phosphoribosylformimino-5-aminoimidazole carboxamide ribotide isomerase [Lachnospiraceae bacterium]|jgi:phosphoribosylformimino-5-aminoimidazole carboxamide ribotide isomerase|nr:phosphoribosylformimino-5-aminoimidazole carboxamide ribotide isomerase [Lachnospiraceae bacterium]
MRLRPCIDIHNGHVKQVVGSTVNDGRNRVRENFVSFSPAANYARIYRKKDLPGGHVILLDSAAEKPEAYEADRQQAFGALRAYPGGLQAGGGIGPENCGGFLDAGASHVIVTSYVFTDGRLDEGRLRKIQAAAGPEHLVLDLSCRREENGDFTVCTDRWKKRTSLVLGADTLEQLSLECAEFLIHASDVEGRREGIEEDLVKLLGNWLGSRKERPFPVTYAGGVHSLEDLGRIAACSGGRLDVTVGSALDLFGGELTLDALAAEAARLS